MDRGGALRQGTGRGGGWVGEDRVSEFLVETIDREDFDVRRGGTAEGECEVEPRLALPARQPPHHRACVSTPELPARLTQVASATRRRQQRACKHCHQAGWKRAMERRRGMRRRGGYRSCGATREPAAGLRSE